ncbi:hypothetical protein CK203_072528 [Vitis vinifera]|uniref:Uncharacterized protein n=1 Tax=Vitis vinifera TaxID=29760 RepID=A0A438F8X2_VITVI|nr:hypothetical protein CK203_072528 [Vitis vinifera]
MFDNSGYFCIQSRVWMIEAVLLVWLCWSSSFIGAKATVTDPVEGIGPSRAHIVQGLTFSLGLLSPDSQGLHMARATAKFKLAFALGGILLVPPP